MAMCYTPVHLDNFTMSACGFSTLIPAFIFSVSIITSPRFVGHFPSLANIVQLQIFRRVSCVAKTRGFMDTHNRSIP